MLLNEKSTSCSDPEGKKKARVMMASNGGGRRYERPGDNNNFTPFYTRKKATL
jgi:hypothetical protein